jgi:hypothetical protein
LRAEGETIIHDAECVRKSYPHFFHDLSKLGVDVLGWELDWYRICDNYFWREPWQTSGCYR